ncbi:helix-turn-helix domain-containing protein [Planomonospora sp. ID82291]|uniref:AlbA family DNA-binding domain-containing protein n=1 Tax=Planomonospora sp. ID82291 TaxID=2738136 RepID=UPI0018C417FD|nr:ATP-binding protein [Planomonospora sp. ID82291]MBG0818338.1 ATP-binding protein [Planomonospora sp. ID82291]
MVFRSARLNAIFGAPPEKVTYEQLCALIGNPAAAEAEDLDYKRLYEQGDKGNEDIATDIAAFANHRGGVIVVGMDEVRATAVPSRAPGVDLGDPIKRRIRQVAADRIFPTPLFELRELPDPNSPATAPRGLLLIIVPPSTSAPHALVKPGSKNSVLCYPRRHGSQKIYLSESEIAAAYRRRFVAAVDQTTRLAQVETDIVTGLTRANGAISPSGPFLIVSLAPDVPGDFLLDRTSFRAFQQDIQCDEVLLGSGEPGLLSAAAVGQGRLICSDRRNELEDARAELHTDGAGALVVDVGGSRADRITLQPEVGTVHTLHVHDSVIVLWIASALRYLARHARDRTGAGGLAATAVTLLADAALHPCNTALPQPNATVRITTVSPHGVPDRPYGSNAQAHATGHADFLLDDLADDGQELAAAAAQLAGDLFHAYNAIEARQITRDGILRQQTWGPEWAYARRWAAAAAIPTDPPLAD